MVHSEDEIMKSYPALLSEAARRATHLHLFIENELLLEAKNPENRVPMRLKERLRDMSIEVATLSGQLDREARLNAVPDGKAFKRS